MIKLTDNAKKELDAFFADKEKSTIRVFLAPGGWRGPKLSLALDESKSDDTTLEVEGFSFCIETSLLNQIGSATIDISYMGFTIEPEKPLNSGDSGCSSCGSGGSCSI